MLIQGLGGKRAPTEMINMSAGEHTRPLEALNSKHLPEKMSFQHTTRLGQNEKMLQKAEFDTEIALKFIQGDELM